MRILTSNELSKNIKGLISKRVKYEYIPLSLILIFFVSIKLMWPILYALLVYATYRLCDALINSIQIIWLKKILSYFFMIIGVFFIAICTRVLVAEIFIVPSRSMEDSIFPGDIILLNKLSYGPIIPTDPIEIPWINLFYHSSSKKAKKTPNWNNKRLSGYDEFGRNEVMFFFHPMKNQIFVKRCIALPGDTLQIINTMVYIDSRLLHEPNSVRKRYQLFTNNLQKPSNTLQKLNIGMHRIKRSEGSISMTLNSGDLELLKTISSIDSIVVKPFKVDTINRNFPHNRYWSEDYFGPYVIPSKGMTILLDSTNFKLYSSVINYGEGLNKKLVQHSNKFFIGEQEIKEYTFINNYFFMMGDNRRDSNDSRYWGPVSEKNILGEASLILFSIQQNKIRWDRVLSWIE